MKKASFYRCCLTAILVSLASTGVAHAADVSPVVVGKNNWLFSTYEFSHASDQADTQATIDLLTKMNKLFKARGITLGLVIVPSKIRIYAEHLPTSSPLDTYTAEKYERVVATLRSNGVNVINLNQAFLNSPLRASDTPLFLQLDTHWGSTGALLAAETVRTGINDTPALKAAWGATREEKYRLAWLDKKMPTRGRDLVRLLPKEQQEYPFELVRLFKVTRENAAAPDLLGAGEKIGITAIGSSYSNKNTGYPDALRYTLQRNLLDISIPVDQGPWVGMENYLRDDAFKSAPPKLILWEIPEREMRSPPDYKFRDARYIIGKDEWYGRMVNLLKP